MRDVLPATVQVKLAANTAPKQIAVPALAADVRANVGLGNAAANAAQVDASLAAHVAPGAQSTGVSLLGRAPRPVGVAGRQIASLDAGTHASAGLRAQPLGRCPGWTPHSTAGPTRAWR